MRYWDNPQSHPRTIGLSVSFEAIAFLAQVLEFLIQEDERVMGQSLTYRPFHFTLLSPDHHFSTS
jgi:hypothetical protein